MLENTRYELLETRNDENGFEAIITIHNNNKEENFIIRYVDGLPEFIVIIDDLVKHGRVCQLSKEDYKKEFIHLNEYIDLDSYYVECRIIDRKLKNLFGDYWIVWGVV